MDTDSREETCPHCQGKNEITKKEQKDRKATCSNCNRSFKVSLHKQKVAKEEDIPFFSKPESWFPVTILSLVLFVILALFITPWHRVPSIPWDKFPTFPTHYFRSTTHASLHIAIREADLEDVKLHVAKGADVTAADHPYPRPLRYAAFHGRLNICKFLIEKGADPSHLPRGGKYPETIARERGHRVTAHYLSQERLRIQREEYFE